MDECPGEETVPDTGETDEFFMAFVTLVRERSVMVRERSVMCIGCGPSTPISAKTATVLLESSQTSDDDARCR